MNIELMQPLVIFPDEFFTVIKNESEFKIWHRLQYINSKHEFKEDSITSILQSYSTLADDRTFYETQLKFFLIRNANSFHYNENELVDLISLWESYVSQKFQSSLTLLLIGIQTLSVSILVKYGKYYYDWNSYSNYVTNWNKCTIDLASWKKYRFLSIPADFDFVKPMFRDHGALSFPLGHMRMLFDEYVEDIYEKEFKPRLLNKILVEKEKSILERVLFNGGSDDDKKYLTNTFRLHNWKTVSENLSKCLANEIFLNDIDIHHNLNFSKYFTLLKYYEELSIKPSGVEKEVFAMWFKYVPTDPKRKASYEEAIKDFYDRLRQSSIKATWGEFKSIFSKNGSKTKIEWIGDAAELNFIFRKLHKVLIFQGGKWKAITFYFFKSNPNDDSLNPDKLAANSHYKNDLLDKHLDRLINTLS